AVAAYRAFGEFEQDDDFRIWFLRILARTYLASRPREAARAGMADLDDTPDLHLYAQSAGAGFPTAGDDPAAQLLNALGAERVMVAVDRLSEDYRLVCTLYFVADLGYEEIARVLDCPVGTVRSRLHRGRKMLQKALWQIAEADGVAPGRGGDT
ncbi:MAG: sigma-70 family RNA polymerase sigma factor, partial [Gemmatimonadales bacterium]